MAAANPHPNSMQDSRKTEKRIVDTNAPKHFVARGTLAFEA
jgi:hypothetical protein